MKKFKVELDEAGVRADLFVATKFNKYARSALKQLFDAGDIKINSTNAKPGGKLRINDVVVVDDSKLNMRVPEIDLPIIYEDDDVVVINKPSGVLSHSKGGLELEASVASFIRGKLEQGGVKDQRAGIVHRLDRATSGVMICAKNTNSLVYLQRQFAKRSTQKAYLAIIEGSLKNPTAIIEAPIARNPKKPTTFKVHSTGKPATTRYRTIKTTEKFSYLELEPLTGRTHQLRVHLQYLNHPIVGDWLYGGKSADRLMLHARSLVLRLPDGKDKTFIAELPMDFNSYLEVCGLNE